MIQIRFMFVAFFLMFSFAFRTPQANVYLAQSSAGAIDATSCANARAISYFNSSGNWGSGSTQIGPSTVVHLCGTLTTAIAFQASGTAGNVTKVLFETGAKFSAATWAGNAKIIDMGSGLSYIEVDGGTNGIIEATDNGSSDNYSNQSSFFGIEGEVCSHCRIHNLTIGDLFIKDEAGEDGYPNSGCGICMEDSNNLQIDHNVIHDVQTCVDLSTSSHDMSALEENNNTLFHCSAGTNMGVNGDHAVSGFLFHDNEIYDWCNWDLTSNHLHHDGLHIFPNGGTGTTTITGFQGYNNYFHGCVGFMTANFYMEINSGTMTSPLFFNNVFEKTDNITNAFIYLEPGAGVGTLSNPGIYNNTFVSDGCCGAAIEYVASPALTGVSSKNNIFISNYIVNQCNSSCTPSTSDYNFWYLNGWGGPGANNPPPQNNVTVLANWTGTYPTLDVHTIGTQTDPGLTIYVPTSSSNVYHAGVDLSGLSITALNTSRNGVARGSGSPWTIGANDDGSIPCTSDHLAFVSQPSNAGVGISFGTITVAIKDVSGNTCPSATDTITLTATGGTCTGMTFSGTTSGAASSGVFTTTNMSSDAAGGCSLNASASGLTGATSDPFIVSSASLLKRFPNREIRKN